MLLLELTMSKQKQLMNKHSEVMVELNIGWKKL